MTHTLTHSSKSTHTALDKARIFEQYRDGDILNDTIDEEECQERAGKDDGDLCGALLRQGKSDAEHRRQGWWSVGESGHGWVKWRRECMRRMFRRRRRRRSSVERK